MIPTARSTNSALLSSKIVFIPIFKKLRAMPIPIVPAPTIPTLRIYSFSRISVLYTQIKIKYIREELWVFAWRYDWVV